MPTKSPLLDLRDGQTLQPNSSPSIRVFFSIGFRSFYFFSALAAVLLLPVWLLLWNSRRSLQTALPGIYWHSHEMLWGWLAAVIAGFLLTAVRVWTKRPSISGWPLALLVLLWILGRVLMMTPYTFAASMVDVLFLPLVTCAVAWPLLRSGNRRNYFVILLLTCMAVTNMALHWGFLSNNIYQVVWSFTAMLHLVTVMVTVMAGRVVPFFIGMGERTSTPRKYRVIELLSIGSVLVLALVHIANIQPLIPSFVYAGFCLLAAVIHAYRMLLWDVRSTRKHALLWSLVLAYSWLPIALVLLACAELGLVITSVATHALTFGLFAGMILAMMTRTTRGHTGRMLVTGSVERWIFLSIHAGAIVRVFGPIVVPDYINQVMVLAGVLWIVAFGLFLLVYGPWLMQRRADGRPD